MSGEHDLPPGHGECDTCGVRWTGDDNTEEAAHCDALRRAERRIAELERERDALKAARDGKYFRDASEADLRAAMSRISYASGIYYQAEYESAPAHPIEVADHIERWLEEVEARDEATAGREESEALIIAELERERDEARLIALSSERRTHAEALGRVWGVDIADADGPGGAHELACEAKMRLLREAPDA